MFVTSEGAVNGYDVVAYFKDSKPVKGSQQYVYEWNEAAWHFSNENNLNDFKANPEKYAPQYGGYCAYGTADGHKAPTEPDAWTIVNDKLYLNYNKEVQSEWMKDRPDLIKKADINWPEVKGHKF